MLDDAIGRNGEEIEIEDIIGEEILVNAVSNLLRTPLEIDDQDRTAQRSSKPDTGLRPRDKEST